MKWILNKARFVRKELVTISLCNIFYALFGVFFAFVSKKLIDVASNNSSGNLTHIILVLIFMLILELLIQMLMSVLDVHTKGKLSIYCKEQFYKKILYKDYKTVSRYHSGDLLNRITNDFSVVTTGIAEIVPDFLLILTRLLASFVAVFYLDITFGIICVLACPFIAVSSRVYGKRIKKLHKKCQETEGASRSFMQETLKNILMIKSFGKEEEMTERGTALQKENFKYSIRRNYVSMIVNALYYIVMTAGYYLALGWGAYRISTGFMTFGTMTALLQLVGQIQSPVRSFASFIPRYYSIMASAERIMELENLEDDTADYLSKEECDALYDKMQKIEISNVFFKYDKDYILKDFSEEINKGDFVVISGVSGIGKSTLMKILLGIYEPEQGRTCVVFENGRQDISANMRKLFAYVPQGNMILSGTIRENIALAKVGAKEEEIIKAAKIAKIWDYIATLPNGLDTVLGEEGEGLSEGQVQRLAIARAVLYDAPIFLLDEATSAIDEKTEIEILKGIKELENKTCIIISHKDAAMKFCDKNIVFE